ncbi:hypothetical protein TVAG_430660 [Trichomonas vaginalis G3]|uniref:Uncharacterized protein n=1 Tax=Trichomonas vaginalis (strain ATCC PRA-98 / G3) TaxID=412133 RepID=A2E391_TRIV3|nr:hypothetical protein TVAGG3_1017720 [Trichomonas vaginalis G3]EAY12901.1 hypothetical protein TVAG_430660 [Trichomonas vaginalis G3]KAI5491928.1 hypothetical protein TVAGG3_1017720 [Trichomonas vaginalis G3]|eukprot:XP_001325124.1 hypothetical protein [Trichomonas vaginalis G3]
MDYYFYQELDGKIPYLSYSERLAFKISNPVKYYEKVSGDDHKSTYKIVHKDFTNEEKQLVTEYLELMKFISTEVNFNYIPFQLLEKLKNRSLKAVTNYMKDLIQFNFKIPTSSPEIRLYKPFKRQIFEPVKFENISNASQALHGISEVKQVDGLIYLIKFSNESEDPIIVDLRNDKVIDFTHKLYTKEGSITSFFKNIVGNNNWVIVPTFNSLIRFDLNRPGKLDNVLTYYSNNISLLQNYDSEELKNASLIASEYTDGTFLFKTDTKLIFYTNSDFSEYSHFEHEVHSPNKAATEFESAKVVKYSDLNGNNLEDYIDIIFVSKSDKGVYHCSVKGTNLTETHYLVDKSKRNLINFELIPCEGEALVFANLENIFIRTLKNLNGHHEYLINHSPFLPKKCALMNSSFAFVQQEDEDLFVVYTMDIDLMREPKRVMELHDCTKIIPFDYIIRKDDKSDVNKKSDIHKIFFAVGSKDKIDFFRPNTDRNYYSIECPDIIDFFISSRTGNLVIFQGDGSLRVCKMKNELFYETEAENQI